MIAKVKKTNHSSRYEIWSQYYIVRWESFCLLNLSMVLHILNYLKRYTLYEDGKIDRSKFKRWCVTNSIPIPRALVECENKPDYSYHITKNMIWPIFHSDVNLGKVLRVDISFRTKNTLFENQKPSEQNFKFENRTKSCKVQFISVCFVKTCATQVARLLFASEGVGNIPAILKFKYCTCRN